MPERRAVLYLLFFLSGAAGLMFEILWIRALGFTFGTTPAAVSTVVASFMTGLAIGNVWMGPLADRRADPIGFYARIELAIGLCSVALSWLLFEGQMFAAALAGTVRGSGAAGTGVRFAVVFVLLLLPTTLMGATLPVISRALVRAGVSGRVVGSLYAVNTAGAVAGTLLPDLLLIPNVGLRRTALVAGAFNLTAAFVASRLARSERTLGASDPAPTQPPGVAGLGPDRSQRRAAVALFALSGLCALGYEVIWSRLLQHLSAFHVASISIVLAVFLSCLALGSAAAARFADDSRRPVAAAALCIGITALAALAPLAVAEPWVAWLSHLIPRDRSFYREDPRIALVQTLAHALFLQGPACVAMGAAFPFLAAAGVDPGNVGRSTGRLIAANTLAGTAGALLVGFAALPRLGSQVALYAVAGLALALSGAAAWRASGGLRWVHLGTIAAAVALMLQLPSDLLHRVGFPRAPNTVIERIDEGVTTTIALVTHLQFEQPIARELRTPGVSMSANGAGARRYMGMMAHLPWFFSKGRKHALLICYGVGNTARSMLSHPDLERLDVVDISPEVLAASPFFTQPNIGPDPLRDPRARVFVDDGRQHLLTSGERYDAITLEPPPPTFAGVSNLYSRDYYAIAARALEPGGVVAQWLPAVQLSASEIASITAALAAELPHTALFYGHANHLILLGSNRPLTIDLLEWDRAASAGPVQADFARSRIAGVDDLIASFRQGDAGLRAAIADARPLTDDLPTLQYPSEAVPKPVRFPPGFFTAPREVLALLRPGVPSERLQSLERQLQAHALMHDALPDGVLGGGLVRELFFGPRLHDALQLVPKHPALLALLELDDDRVRCARQHLASGADDPEASFLLARRAYYEGAYAQALERLRQVDSRKVDTGSYALLLAGALRATGHPDDARRGLTRLADAIEQPAIAARVRQLAADTAEPLPPDRAPLSVAVR